jgi:ketosteroid isomerase-like protein
VAPLVVVPATPPAARAPVHQGAAATAIPANERAPAPAPAAVAETEARELVTQWAAAWSARDVSRYLAFYAPDFTPDKGVPLAAWEATRRKRLQAPRSIKVEVRDLRIETAGDNRLIARFTQDYAADAYRESGTTKLLLLTRRDGAWKIVTEL